MVVFQAAFDESHEVYQFATEISNLIKIHSIFSLKYAKFSLQNNFIFFLKKSEVK
jgi:hypothetical protein